MERLHMNHLRDIIHRLRAGESERRIARDLKISRPTVHKYHELAKREGYLEAKLDLPGDANLTEVLGPGPQPPKITSSLEPYREAVKNLLKQGVEMVAMWQRLRDNYGYAGSYSAVRRFVSHLEPDIPEAYTRVHTAPGEEMQVDFGSVGQLYDPTMGGKHKAAIDTTNISFGRRKTVACIHVGMRRNLLYKLR